MVSLRVGVGNETQNLNHYLTPINMDNIKKLKTSLGENEKKFDLLYNVSGKVK